MGLVTGLLTLPLAPVRGVVWVAERLYEQAEQEMDDSRSIRQRLMDVQAARDAGVLSEEEAAEQEADLFRHLWESRREAGGRKG